MAEAGNYGARYPYFYGPEGRLVLVDSALEAVRRGSTTIGIKTPAFAMLASHIKPVRPLIDPAEKIFTIDGHVGATGSGYIGDMSIEQAVALSNKAIEKALGERPVVEIGVVSAQDRQFQKFR